MRTATLAGAAIVVLAAFGALAYAVHSFTRDPGLPTLISLRAERDTIRVGEVDRLSGVAIGARPQTRLLLAANEHPGTRAYHSAGLLPPIMPGGTFEFDVRPRVTTLYRVVAKIDHAITSRAVEVTVVP